MVEAILIFGKSRGSVEDQKTAAGTPKLPLASISLDANTTNTEFLSDVFIVSDFNARVVFKTLLRVDTRCHPYYKTNTAEDCKYS